MPRNNISHFTPALFFGLLTLCSASSAWSQEDFGQAAVALERKGEFVQAETAWKVLAKQYPKSPDPSAHIGLLEARQGHYTEAIAWYKNAMALNPAMPGLRLNLGLAYFKTGNYQQTIQQLTPLLKAQPDDQRLTILVGMSYYGLSQFVAASPLLKRATDQDPKNLTLLLTLAHSCLLSHQYQCVLEAYHRILGLNSESAEADMLVGEALDEMKDTEGAIREFRAAEAANPKEPNVHFGLGYLLWKKNDYTGAAPEFQAEIDNDAQHFQAMLYLADSDLQLNRLDDAGNLLEKLERIDSDSFREHLDLGIVYAGQGKNESALVEFQRAIKIDPKAASAHWRLARLYRAMGRTQESKVEFEKTKSVNQAEDERLLKIMSTLPSKPVPDSGGPAHRNQ
jgi:tetratricopeptide (TPR) repeat protein